MEERQGEKQEVIKLRNHFTYIFEQMWHLAVLFVCILFGSEDSIRIGVNLIWRGNIVQGLLAMGGALLLILLACLWYVNRWYRTTITIQDGTITSSKATLNRRVNTMSVDKISNINLEQNLFEMLVGTYKLKMDTNSMSTADTTDLEIVLKKKDAERVKRLLLSMQKAMGEEQEEDFDVIQGGYDVVYSNQKIVVNGLITMSVIECITAICLLGISVFSIAVVFQEEKDIIVIVSTILLQLLAAGSVVADIIRKWLQDFHFRAKRDKDKVYVSCGLLKKKSYVVPVDKINAVTLRYTFLGRICKRAYVKVIHIGGQGEEADGMKLLLTDSYEELERKLHILLPEFALPEIDGMIKPPKRLKGLYGLYAVLYGMLAFLGFTGAVYLLGESQTGQKECWFGLLVGLLVGSLIYYIYYMKYLASGILYKENNFIISRGIFARTIQTIPYDRIQYIHMEQGPLDRKLGLAKGYISILASTLSRIQYMGLFESGDFDGLEERLRETY